MNSVEYNTLSIQKQASLFKTKGKYFDERIEYNKRIWKYYMLFDFIVEVEYSLEGNKILSITTFTPIEPNSNIIFQEPDEIYG